MAFPCFFFSTAPAHAETCSHMCGIYLTCTLLLSVTSVQALVHRCCAAQTLAATGSSRRQGAVPAGHVPHPLVGDDHLLVEVPGHLALLQVGAMGAVQWTIFLSYLVYLPFLAAPQCSCSNASQLLGGGSSKCNEGDVKGHAP